MNDNDILELVQGSLGGVQMRRPIGEITARGRGLRTRRRSLAGAAAVGVLGASLVVALPLSGSSGHGPSQPVNVDLAAWSVHTNADATVTITLREFGNPGRLRQILADAGIRAVVTRDCAHDGNGQPQITNVMTVHREGDDTTLTLKPAAMPPGSVLLIDYDKTAPASVHAPKAGATPGTEPVTVIVIALLASAPQCASY